MYWCIGKVLDLMVFEVYSRKNEIILFIGKVYKLGFRVGYMDVWGFLEIIGFGFYNCIVLFRFFYLEGGFSLVFVLVRKGDKRVLVIIVVYVWGSYR